MKKYISKFLTLAFAAFGTFSFLLFSSCDGVIFHTIRDEVELADAKLSGDIQNIVRYKDEIFASTGEIYHRDTSDTKKDWSSFSTPSGYVFSLAADSDNLYALSVSLEEDDDGYNVAKSRTLYCYDGSSWKQIWSASYSSSVYAILFCTNSPKEANREAYFRYGSTVWKLDGTTSLTADNTFPTDSTDNSTTPTTGVRSCTKLGETTYFSSAYAMASNETVDEESTYIYRCDSSTIYYLKKDDSSWSSVNLGCDTIYSIGITKDYILVGTKSGIEHQKWSTTATTTGGVPATGTADFDTNAASTLSSYYEVPAILVVDPAQAEKAATIYASSITSSSSASLNNVGLWSYFASKGEWNRE